jgi:hypothetical protein
MSAPVVLLSIPSVRLVHIPSPGQEITLASGELSLTELPTEPGHGNTLKALALSGKQRIEVHDSRQRR